MFGITALKVIVMIAYGLPGFILVKLKALNENSIKAFAKLLLYVCQPALTVYALSAAECTPQLLKNMGVFFVLSLLGQVAIIGLYYAVFRKKAKTDTGHKICAVAGACGNVGFLGIPLLEYLLPGKPEMLIYSTAFSISMNIIAWTLGLLMMTGDKKYISIKAFVANPATISFLVAFPLFVFNVKLPDVLGEYIETLGRMSTVICMTVLGMRLATKSFKRMFTNGKIYLAAFSKLIMFPIIVGAIFAIAPVGTDVRDAAFVMCCCPAAAMIQSLAETHGGDSETAANIVLSTSLMCTVTIPLMWTAYNAIFM